MGMMFVSIEYREREREREREKETDFPQVYSALQTGGARVREINSEAENKERF